VDGVDGDAGADLGKARSQNSTALNAVESAVALDSQDEVGAGAAVEGLLDGDPVAAEGVDLEGTGELVDTGGVIVGVAVLGSQMAIGAARAAGATVGARGNAEGAAAGAATSTSLKLETGGDLSPGAALKRSGGHGHGGSRKAGEDTLDKHFEGDLVLESTDWRDLKLAVRTTDCDGPRSAADQGSFIQKPCWPGITSANMYSHTILVCHTCKLPSIQFQRGSGADGIFHLYEA
jgi:hypothetical protein